MSSKGWAIFFAVLTAVLLGLWFLPKGSAQRVGIYQNGQLLYTAELTEPLVDPIYGIESDTALSSRSCAYGNYNSDDIYRIAYISYGQLTYNRQHQSCGARVRIDAIAFR
mgnify:CR=1 FL=1